MNRTAVHVLWLAVAAAGCGGGSSGSSAGGGSTASGLVAPAGGGGSSGTATTLVPPSGTWLKGDFHVHSNWSGDATSLGDDIGVVIQCAERAGLDFTTISDHRVTNCLTDPKFLSAKTPLILIAGEEWGGPGHAGAHGLTRPPIFQSEDGATAADCCSSIQQSIDDVHSMGGVFVLNHTIDDSNPWYWPCDRWDGIEIWNQQWALRELAEADASGMQSWMLKNGMMAPGAPQPPPENLAAIQVRGGGLNWQRVALYHAFLNSGRHVAAMGGSDAHYLVLPGSPTTLVFAEQPTVAGIMDGVRRSRTMVARAADAPHLEFTADRDGDGIFETIIGDRIPLAGRPVTFKIHVVGAQDGKLDLVKNGQVFQQWAINAPDFEVTFTDAPTAASWYRVNCWEKLDLSNANAPMLRDLVLGGQGQGFLATLLSGPVASLLGSLAGKIDDVVDTGGPAAVWLVLFGDQMGVKVSPVLSKYPRLEFPPAVSKILNVAVHDQDYCPGVLTSPIWVE
jgi:hypothetical protein